MTPQRNNQYDYLKDKKHWGKKKNFLNLLTKPTEGGGTVDMSLDLDI